MNVPVCVKLLYEACSQIRGYHDVFTKSCTKATLISGLSADGPSPPLL
jgi:hypothetical protein